jgi:hypothetical protein
VFVERGPSLALEVRYPCIKTLVRAHHLGTSSAANTHPVLTLPVPHTGVPRQGQHPVRSFERRHGHGGRLRGITLVDSATSDETHLVCHDILWCASAEMKFCRDPRLVLKTGEVMTLISGARVVNCPACCFGAGAATHTTTPFVTNHSHFRSPLDF